MKGISCVLITVCAVAISARVIQNNWERTGHGDLMKRYVTFHLHLIKNQINIKQTKM